MSSEFKTLSKIINSELTTSRPGDDPSVINQFNTPFETGLESVILSKFDVEGKLITFNLIPWDPIVSAN